MIDLALHYAGRGWPVFPLVPGGKVPVIPRREGGRGCHDATTVAAAIEQWWHRWPEANIGIATGLASGLLVLDVDCKAGKPGLASLQKLAPAPTFTVRTASGGFHLYYRMPPGAPISIGADLLPGLDWRGEGGYVVAAGSIVNGTVYEIARQLPIAAMPARIVALMRQARRRPAVVASPTGGAVIPEGARDNTLIRIAGSLRRYGIEAPAILGALRAVNREHCRPPLDDADLHRIAQSAAGYPVAERTAT